MTRKDAGRPLISVILAAKNEEKVIGDCIRSLCRQAGMRGKYEIVVVDDGSTDSTCDIVRELSGEFDEPVIRLVRKKTSGGKASAVNAGVKASNSKYILITDADAIVPEDWMRTMYRGLREYDTVQGVWYCHDPQTFAEKLEHSLTLARFRYGGTYGRPKRMGTNNGFRREVFTRVGEFSTDTKHTTQEFYYRAEKKGHTMGFLPESHLLIRTNRNMLPFIRRMLRWRTIDSLKSLKSASLGSFVFTFLLSVFTFGVLFILPFLQGYFPLFLHWYLSWWTFPVMWTVFVAGILAVDTARFARPLKRMLGHDARAEDRPYVRYVLLLPLFMFLLRVLTVPYYIYTIFKPGRTAAFTPERD